MCPKTTFRSEALDLMTSLADDITSQLAVIATSSEITGYVSQRSIISDVFAKTSGAQYSLSSIMLRLTVIDSLYSTNARYSYYSIEQLAEEIWKLGSEKAVSDYFDSIVHGGKDVKELFVKSYGLRKNLEQGNTLMSLISKYAYYVLLSDKTSYPLCFPIYDSLVMDVYPTVCSNLGLNKVFGKSASPNIETYVSALNDVRTALFGNNENLFNGFQQFDILDAYLWRMGKFCNGNFSLLFNESDYSIFVTNLGLKDKDGDQLHLLFPKLKSKNGKVEFTDVTGYQCRTMPVANIVDNLSNAQLMTKLLEHWKRYY